LREAAAGDGAPGALGGSAFVLATSWDGRLGAAADADTGAVISFADLSPSTVALSLVPNVAASCVPLLLGLKGPAVTLATGEGLDAALDVAAGYLTRGAPAVLAQEFELAPPRPLYLPGEEPAGDYALGLLVATTRIAGLPVLGEVTVGARPRSRPPGRGRSRPRTGVPP